MTKRLPLSGVRVLAMEHVFAVPLGTLGLAALGAEVIRVESASRPDSEDPSARATAGGYRHANRNKRAIALDLQFEEGRRLFKDLVAKSDIVVENFTRRVLTNFGLDYLNLQAIKPDIIMLSVTGYGQTGPYADYKAYGPNLESMAGQVWLTGYDGRGPHRVGGGVFTDTLGGHTVTMALLAALIKRKKTGRGSRIDLSLYEATTSLLGESLIATQLGQPLFHQQGNRHPWMAPHGCFPCLGENRYVAIAIENDAQWDALSNVVGHGESWAFNADYRSAKGRFEARDAIEARLANWTRTQRRDVVAPVLAQAGVPAVAVADARDVVLGEHFWEAGSFEWMDMSGVAPEMGYKLDMAPPWRFSKADLSLTAPPPIELGEANQYVFGEILALPDSQIAELELLGVLSREAKPRTPRPKLSGPAMLQLGSAAAFDEDHAERLEEMRRRATSHH